MTQKSGAQLQLEIDAYLAREPSQKAAPPRLEAAIIEDVFAHAPTSGKTSAQLEHEIRVNAYEAKQERKRERLEAASKKAAARSSAAFGTAHRIGEMIPMGQPILRAHHSEKRHRRDVAKIDSSMRKGIAEDKYAKELAARAASVGTAGISSDDPEAVKKLKIELNKLQLDQDRMKAGNAAIRKHAKTGPEAQVAALVAMGFSEKLSRSALEKDFAGRIGFPDYAIRNNGANLRRIEKRIAELVEKETTPARESIKGGDDALSWEIRENKDLNRTQIAFSGQPPKEIRERLKSAGFKWAPTEGAWQRHLSNGAWYHAKQALGVK